MAGSIGVRRETRSSWERRTPVTPKLARRLADVGVTLYVQPSARRVFHDKEYVRAGAIMASDLSAANTILGVKEIPPEAFISGAAYMYFAHVIKGQPPNMPALQRLLELGCTLIDYETIRDSDGRRLVSFGRFAGLAGMIDTLWALGERLLWEGIRNPFESIDQAHTYPSLEDARAAVREAGHRIESEGLPRELSPLVVGVAGYGNVAGGVREILAELPVREVMPRQLPELQGSDLRHAAVQCTFKEQDLVAPTERGRTFDLLEYYRHPERYQTSFAPHLQHLSVLVNCCYWDPRYPRMVALDDLIELYAQPGRPRLRILGDIACDVGGNIECTTRTTEPGDPVYVWDPTTGSTTAGIAGDGPVVLAVDMLPSELPREASLEFSRAIWPFLPPLASVDWQVSLEKLQLPGAIRRAVIVHRGQLAPEFRYLDAHLQTRAG